MQFTKLRLTGFKSFVEPIELPIEPGVTGKLRSCADAWCQVEVKGFEGWVLRDEIYGVYTAEVIN